MYMSFLFLIAHIKKDNSIVDVGWGIGFILVNLFALWQQGMYETRHLLITTLIIIWGVRLTLHIFVRNLGKEEDPRYVNMRTAWGNNQALRSFLQIFMVQAVAMFCIALPLIHINCYPGFCLSALDIVGTHIWIVGFLCECISDYQLYKFTTHSHNKGKIMDEGLWRYSRHPNYFGESLMWWGIWIIALATPYAMPTIISPLLITFLILFVSGIPMVEKLFDTNEAYQQYKQRTSTFIPWPPSKKK